MSPSLRTASCIWTETISRSFVSSAVSFRRSMCSVAGNAVDVSAASGKLGLQRLKAAIEMVDAMQHGFALGREGGDHQRHRGPEIGRHDLGAGEAGNAPHFRRIAMEMDIGTQSRKLLNMHETVFEDCLANEG